MNTNENVNARRMVVIGAVLGWIAVTGQLYLIIQNRAQSIPATIVQFFSYFTILSNIIVALCYTFLLRVKNHEQSFWSAASTLGAVTVYILVVGIVYNVVLRFLWAPTGAQKWIDELLHTVAPLYFTAYWIIYGQKQGLKWGHAIAWLGFPFVYLVYVMIRGAVTDKYPYPFLDAYNLGYQKVIISAAVILALFLVLSLTIIAVAKQMAVNERKGSLAG